MDSNTLFDGLDTALVQRLIGQPRLLADPQFLKVSAGTDAVAT